MERGERVIVSANPYYHAAMLDEVRQEVQRAGGIELATILHWTPGLAALRGEDGGKPDPADAVAEEEAMIRLFALADAFVWLANDWRSPRATHAVGQTERILAAWPGRSVHFHWFHDPRNPDPADPVNLALDRVYERAVLDLDYPALRRTMRALAGHFAGRRARATAGAGGDPSLWPPHRLPPNGGDAPAPNRAD